MRIVLCYRPRFYRHWILPKIHARTSTIFPVCLQKIIIDSYSYTFVDGGWLKAHPLPADKSSFGNFEALAQENRQIIKEILESASSVSPVDDQILTKLRNFYGSCLNEDKLNDIGAAPLLHLAQNNQISIQRNQPEHQQ